MPARSGLAAFATSVALLFASGCTWLRGPDRAGAWVDDAAITSTVRARFVEDTSLDANALAVETLNGNVTLSGAAKDNLARQTAENIAIKVRGVKAVRNEIAVRP